MTNFDEWLKSRWMNGIYIGDLEAAWNASRDSALREAAKLGKPLNDVIAELTNGNPEFAKMMDEEHERLAPLIEAAKGQGEPVAWLNKTNGTLHHDGDGVLYSAAFRAGELIPLGVIAPSTEKVSQEPDYYLSYGQQVVTEKPFDGATELFLRPQHNIKPVGVINETGVEWDEDFINSFCTETNLYPAPPTAAIIRELAIRECIKALEENEQFYCRDTLLALIPQPSILEEFAWKIANAIEEKVIGEKCHEQLKSIVNEVLKGGV